MNILIISHDSQLYGPGQCLLTIAKYLKEKGHKVTVVLPAEGPLCISLNNYLIPFIIIRFHWWISGRYEHKNIFTIDFLRRAYYRVMKPLYNWFIALPKFKAIIEKNKFDVVVNNSMVTPIGIMVKLKYKLPLVLYIRESIDDIGLDLPYYFAQKLIQYADGHIFVSSYIQSRYTKLKSKKYRVIYDSLNFNQVNQSIKEKKQISKFVIVGRISPQKGHIHAIQALEMLLNKYPYLQLYIVGTGDSKYLEEYIISHKLQSHIIFTGWTNTPEEYYKKCDCSIICSVNEAFGKVIIESMAYGCPVIGRAIASMNELIIPFNNGLLYDGSVKDLAAKMEYAILHPEVINEMSKNAYKYVNEKFKPEHTVEAFEEFIKKIV